jgi:hypothetical protein
MIQKNLLKFALVGLTSALFLSAQSAQVDPGKTTEQKNETVADNDTQVQKVTPPADQDECPCKKKGK